MASCANLTHKSWADAKRGKRENIENSENRKNSGENRSIALSTGRQRFETRSGCLEKNASGSTM
jgi:hypothetical protein